MNCFHDSLFPQGLYSHALRSNPGVWWYWWGCLSVKATCADQDWFAVTYCHLFLMRHLLFGGVLCVHQQGSVVSLALHISHFMQYAALQTMATRYSRNQASSNSKQCWITSKTYFKYECPWDVGSLEKGAGQALKYSIKNVNLMHTCSSQQCRTKVD